MVIDVPSNCECAPVRIVVDREIMPTGATITHMVRRQALAVVVDDRGHDRRPTHKWRQAIGMVDAVLQHRDAGVGTAKPLEPRRAGGCVLCLRAQQHPIHRLCPGGIGQRADRGLDGVLRAVDDQPLKRSPDAGDQIMPANRGNEAGGDAADTAEADHGHTRLSGIAGVR
jgi:hypothetical protein